MNKEVFEANMESESGYRYTSGTCTYDELNPRDTGVKVIISSRKYQQPLRPKDQAELKPEVAEEISKPIDNSRELKRTRSFRFFKKGK